MNGSTKLMPAPRNKPHIVGGEYSIKGELDDDGGDGEASLLPAYSSLSANGSLIPVYSSLSDGMFTEESERSLWI